MKAIDENQIFRKIRIFELVQVVKAAGLADWQLTKFRFNISSLIEGAVPRKIRSLNQSIIELFSFFF